MEAFKTGTRLASVLGPILDDCRDLAQDFGKVTLQLCSRESNYVAHELAKFGRDNPPTLWCDVPPDFILPMLVNDVMMVDG